MFIHVYVSPALAVKAGKSRSGILRVDLSEADIAAMTTAEREQLALCHPMNLGQDHVTGDCWCLKGPISEATPESVVVCLRERIAEKAKQQAEQQARDSARREATLGVLRNRTTKTTTLMTVIARNNYAGVVAAWPYESDDTVIKSDEARAWQAELDAINSVAAKQADDKESARRTAEAVKSAEKQRLESQYVEAREQLIYQIGTEADKGRQEDGLLPEAEADMIVRDHLFAGFDDNTDGMGRYQRLTADDVQHVENGYGECDGDIEFEAETATELPPAEWKNLRVIKAGISGISDDATVTPRIHRAKCERCDAKTVRYSASVSIVWHGHSFVREYAL